eukprot:Skav218668  [mRNA]  locus=scaffold5113:39227:40726:+ [translate_table: standard]
MTSAASPETFFGSNEYFQGARLNAQGYTYIDALTIQHEATGIKMWSCAIDIREDAGHQGLRAGDQVLFHYTPEDAFKKITSLENPKLLAPMDENNKDSYFGLGIYATMKAPHEWNSKEEVLVNNYYPTRDNFKGKQGLDLPQPDIPFNTALNGAVGNYVKDQYQGKADCCIPLIVDEQVSKNVMEETTDGPLMPNGRKRLKGTNCFGERQPFWRDVWLVSIYTQTRVENIGVKDAEQSSVEIVQILGKRLETDELVQDLAKYDIENYREIQKKLLVKVIEMKPADYHACYNLAYTLAPEETVTMQLQTGPRTFSRRELYLKAIKLDNKFALAYNNLANQLSPEETTRVELQSGLKTFNQKELYMEAIKLDNKYACAYSNLGARLSPKETVRVQLQTGVRIFDEKELYMEAIKLDNNLAVAYYNLGTKLSAEETVRVLLQTGSRTFNAKELYLEAIKLDNKHAKAYNNLGHMLWFWETVEVQLQTGSKRLTKQELLNWRS